MHGISRDAREHIAEPGEGLDPAALAGGNSGPPCSSRSAAPVGSAAVFTVQSAAYFRRTSSITLMEAEMQLVAFACSLCCSRLRHL